MQFLFFEMHLDLIFFLVNAKHTVYGGPEHCAINLTGGLHT